MDNLITYLLNYAFDHGYGYEILNDAENDWPSLAYPELNLIFINMNWHNQNELPFQIAHEIGHMIDGNACHMYNDKIKVEDHADLHAIEILKQYSLDYDFCINNPIVFAQQFCIPYRLYNVVESKWYA
ncbi:ImmA/IrrE family metallo-endopeptidase [Bombilactobacillus bombi]|uniref:ImmA/IrrE family metallo-endopeptidase n=1 Tax=Bombilactobacillus bombi TaxID=1303590 RepID=A0A417ZER2_9LACO|nr:ImmA/IrrE family metallo-endopeptidase [Bombilactobacillus bombi]RHW49696.1 ImmA/IrrE family metallo-endopeptidase [Bombilactobacillus bombi]